MRLPFARVASWLWLATSLTPLAWAGSPPTATTAPVLSTGLAMQFTSAGHVLGFTSEGILVAGRDHVLKVSFVGATAVAPRAGKSGEYPASGGSTLTEVHYRNLWPGIDLLYDGQNGIVRSTWTLAPESNPEAIRLAYNVPIELTKDGALKLTFATGTMQESAPLAWQVIEGERYPIPVAFRKHENGELGYALGEYDPAHPLTIDPTLSWNTFLGGTGSDFGVNIAIDSAGNVYVTGSSDATWGAPVRGYTSSYDSFVAKLNAATSALVWNTFLGGTGSDTGYGIATDASGNVYVTGRSGATWGTPVRPYMGGLVGDGFVARLSGSTGALSWNTFLGGTQSDDSSGIATDTSGYVYVTGQSGATWGTPVRAYSSSLDAYVAKLNTMTGALVWNTFLGGGDVDFGVDIATDGSGNVYVIGESKATWSTPVRAYSAVYDAFVAKLNATTGVLDWNTFLGSAADDGGRGIATDTSGNVYVNGFSGSSWGTPVRAYTSPHDAFVAKLNGTTGAITWNTFLGGTGGDISHGIATDALSNVYVTGYSTSSWGTPVRAFGGGAFDALVARLSGTTGALTWNTFLGGVGDDRGFGIASDTAGNVYVTGYSTSSWGTPVRAYTTGDDAFVAQLGMASAPPPATTLPVPIAANTYACEAVPGTPVISATPASAKPLAVTNPTSTDVRVVLQTTAFTGAVDVYVTARLHDSSTVIRTPTGWLPYIPANFIPLRALNTVAIDMTSAADNLYAGLLSSLPPGAYQANVIVVPNGMALGSAIAYYNWCYTKTFP